MRFTRWTALTPLCLFAVAALLAPITGCGGSSSQVIDEKTTVPFKSISRETENDFSTDAKILAFRQASGTLLSADDAAQFDADLAKIRAQYNQVAEVHARLDFALTDVLVEIKKDAPFRDKWEAGTLTTGETNLDQLLIAFAAVSVTKLTDSGDTRIFLVKLGQSVNVPALNPYFKSASASVVSAGENATIGDGNQITYKLGLGGAKTYTFSVGAGDCPSGCISRQFYTVTLAPDGTMSLAVSNK